MTALQAKGADIERTATRFSDCSDEIQAQAKKVAESRVTAEMAGRKFHASGKAYVEALDKLEQNVGAFAKEGVKLSESFTQAAKEYQASDDQAADEGRSVKA